jgi:hypothetical protein
MDTNRREWDKWSAASLARPKGSPPMVAKVMLLETGPIVPAALFRDQTSWSAAGRAEMSSLSKTEDHRYQIDRR